MVIWGHLYPRAHMGLWAAIAVAWLVLGANSGGVPWGNVTTWLVINSFVAGAALGVAFRRTADSMFVYLVAALIAGAARSIAYIANGSGGPGWVWVIVTLTNVILLGQWGTRAR